MSTKRSVEPTRNLGDEIQELIDMLADYKKTIDERVVSKGYREIPIKQLVTAKAGVAINPVRPFDIKAMRNVIDRIKEYETASACIPSETDINRAVSIKKELEEQLIEAQKNMDKATERGNAEDLLMYSKSRCALLKIYEKKAIRLQQPDASSTSPQSRSIKQRTQTVQKLAPMYTGKVMEDDRRIYTCDFIFVKNINHISLCLEQFPYLKSYGLIFFRGEIAEKNYVYLGTNVLGQPIIVELAIDTIRGFGDGLGYATNGQQTFSDIPNAYLTYNVPNQCRVAIDMATELRTKRDVKPIPVFNPQECTAYHRKGAEILCGSMHGHEVHNMFITFDRYWLVKAMNNFKRSDKYIIPVSSRQDYEEKVLRMKASGNISDIVDFARRSSESELVQIEQFMPVFVLGNLMLCAILGHHPQFKEHVKV